MRETFLWEKRDFFLPAFLDSNPIAKSRQFWTHNFPSMDRYNRWKVPGPGGSSERMDAILDEEAQTSDGTTHDRKGMRQCVY